MDCTQPRHAAAWEKRGRKERETERERYFIKYSGEQRRLHWRSSPRPAPSCLPPPSRGLPVSKQKPVLKRISLECPHFTAQLHSAARSAARITTQSTIKPENIQCYETIINKLYQLNSIKIKEIVKIQMFLLKFYLLY